MYDSHDPGFSDADFPDVNGKPATEKDVKAKRGYQNEIYANDSLTESFGFINEIKKHSKGEDILYFARVGLLVGSKKDDSKGEWVGDIVNCDLLIGSTLRKWAEFSEQIKEPFRGVRMKFQIRNLKFMAGIHEGKPVLNSRGILETVTFGHIND